MSFPFGFEDNFEDGTTGAWATVSGNNESVASYKTLAEEGLAPFSGAYCLRVAAGSASDSIVISSTTADAMSIANAGIAWIRFNLLFSSDFAATVTDVFTLFELRGVTDNETVAFGAQITADTNVINLGIGSTTNSAVPETFSSNELEKGVWHTVELKVTIGTGGAGAVAMYVTKDGSSQATAAEVSLASKTHIVTTHGALGLQDGLTTTTGTILIDNFIFEDGDNQVYAQIPRYPERVLLTKTGHAFVGPGTISNISLLSGAAADNVLTVYDSDAADSTNKSKTVCELKNTQSSELVDVADTPIDVHRGAYVVMSGTNPRGLLTLRRAPFSQANVVSLGLQG
jgi:hypothetical protein